MTHRTNKRIATRSALGRKQRGVALIIILMLLAIMATIAGSMSERLFTQIQARW